MLALPKELTARLKQPVQVEALLRALSADASAEYNLLFYSAFAAKLFTVIQRPESRNEGFERMQQSFREAVENVREIIAAAGSNGFSEASMMTELSAQGMSRLLELLNDLAIVKQFQRD